mmetsp:Transcript_13890/g.39520  ORF Transcript_13890/g.39520 Transcript_13890/m.39520 type:complete len:327 (-) Transcript_13890:251-1231(-)
MWECRSRPIMSVAPSSTLHPSSRSRFIFAALLCIKFSIVVSNALSFRSTRLSAPTSRSNGLRRWIGFKSSSISSSYWVAPSAAVVSTTMSAPAPTPVSPIRFPTAVRSSAALRRAAMTTDNSVPKPTRAMMSRVRYCSHSYTSTPSWTTLFIRAAGRSRRTSSMNATSSRKAAHSSSALFTMVGTIPCRFSYLNAGERTRFWRFHDSPVSNRIEWLKNLSTTEPNCNLPSLSSGANSMALTALGCVANTIVRPKKEICAQPPLPLSWGTTCSCSTSLERSFHRFWRNSPVNMTLIPISTADTRDPSHMVATNGTSVPSFRTTCDAL